jgi:thiol-disulfide isomerase/thioredoxin
MTGARQIRTFIAVVAALALWMSYGTASAAATYDFNLEELTTGEKLDFELLTTGKPLIFHVWSPECPHCQRHMPYLVAFYKKLDLGEVNFVSCSMGDSKTDAVNYAKQKKLEFPVLYGASGKISSTFSDKGWPTSFVFAPGGKLVGWCDTQSPSYVSEMLDLVDKAMEQ